MSNKKQQIPDIRFKGFTDDWEQRKLEKIFRKIRNAFVGTATPYYVENGHFYLESNNVKDGKINRNSEIFINDEFYEKQRDKWLHTNDLVMVQSGHVGHTAVIPEELDASAAHALIMFQDYKVKSNPYFLNYQFQTSDSRKKLDIITTGNTIKHILASEMKKFEVSLPNPEEQTKIGAFFKHLDDTIALHQLRLNRYKELRQGMLEKMFPQDGEKFPRIRFNGFEDEWEQRQLGEISEKVTEKNKNNSFSETLTNSAEYGIINQRDFFDKDISNEKNLNSYYIVHPDDFVYNPRVSNFAPVGPIGRNKLGRTGVMSPLYYVFRIHNIDKTFLEKYFSSDGWHKFMKLNGDSGARSDRFAIKDAVFQEMPIPFPRLDEQIQIGDYFNHLEKTIDLHHQKVNNYKLNFRTLKKTLKA